MDKLPLPYFSGFVFYKIILKYGGVWQEERKLYLNKYIIYIFKNCDIEIGREAYNLLNCNSSLPHENIRHEAFAICTSVVGKFETKLNAYICTCSGPFNFYFLNLYSPYQLLFL